MAFLIAEKSIKRRFIGAAAKLMQSSAWSEEMCFFVWLTETLA